MNKAEKILKSLNIECTDSWTSQFKTEYATFMVNGKQYCLSVKSTAYAFSCGDNPFDAFCTLDKNRIIQKIQEVLE